METALFHLKKILVAKGVGIDKAIDSLKTADSSLSGKIDGLKNEVAMHKTTQQAEVGKLSTRLDSAEAKIKALESSLAKKEASLRNSISGNVNSILHAMRTADNTLSNRIGSAEGTLRTLPSGKHGLTWHNALANESLDSQAATMRLGRRLRGRSAMPSRLRSPVGGPSRIEDPPLEGSLYHQCQHGRLRADLPWHLRKERVSCRSPPEGLLQVKCKVPLCNNFNASKVIRIP